jgi:folate-binding protein YgfZ
MNTQNIYILEDRGILYVNGLDANEFLQNLITNDINKVDDKNSCFASLLTPQGKYLYDFLIIKHKTGYLLDCEKDLANQLLKQLNIYKLRSRVEILNLSNEFVVMALDYKGFMKFGEAKDYLGYTFKYREDPFLLDPRNKELGGRLIINLEKLYLSLKKLNLKSAEISEYYYFSHKMGIAQKNMKKLQNNIFGIECNFDELNGIDFKKGCYIGQENTARIKLKNKLSKRLLPIEVISGKINEGERIMLEKIDFGKVMIDKDYPYALINFKANNFDFNTIYNINSATVRIIKPNWLNLS